MILEKCIPGIVRQKFDENGRFLGQNFVPHGEIEWEDGFGKTIGRGEGNYFAEIKLVQPPKAPPIETIKVANISNICEGTDVLQLLQEDNNLEFGNENNAATLIKRQILKDILINMDADDLDQQKEIYDVIDIIDNLPEDVFIDLEN